MATKDFSISEDTEHKKPSGEEATAPQKPSEEGESSQIKNAHAVGDGSYGRNDESLSDENEVEDKSKVNKDGSNY